MNKILVIVAITLISAPVQASRVDWEIQFFNSDSIQVGSGDFSYDPDTTIQLIDSPPSAAIVSEVIPPEIIEVSTSFTSFNWTVDGVNWTHEQDDWWGGNLVQGRHESHFEFGKLLLGSVRGAFFFRD